MASIDELRPDTDLTREELMLNIQASILERCLRKEVQEKQTPNERCRALRQKISSMEDELLKAGKGSIVRHCLEDSSRPEFDAVNHNDFLKWLVTSSRSASSTPQHEHAQLPSNKKRIHDPDNGFNVFSVAPANTSDQSKTRTKRVRYTSKDLPPCLRCRVLKKKCDELQPCSHCPPQGFENENDIWKVTGCFRGPLRDFVEIFSPEFVRAPSRTLKHPVGDIAVINFVLTKSRVSHSKQGRIWNLVHTLSDFKLLSGPAWDNANSRESMSRAAISLEQYHGNGDSDASRFGSEDYEAAWAVLQLISMDRCYLTKTAYNLFDLIRIGNLHLIFDRNYWDLYYLARKILRQSVELYLLERLCSQIASGLMIGPIPFDQTKDKPNTLVLVDLKEDIETFLSSFEKVCEGRGKLTWRRQVPTFFALLIFGVAKSVMLDAYAHRESYEDPSPWTRNNGIKMSSAYKTMTSVFCWASKCDIITGTDEEECLGPKAHEELRNLVNLKSWGANGICNTKAFLLNLGTCFLSDGSFNGFLAQKVGIDKIPKSPPDTQPFGLNTQKYYPSENASGTNILKRHDGNVLSAQQKLYPKLENTSGSSSPKSIDTNATSSDQSKLYASITFVSDQDRGVTRRHGGRTGALNSTALEKARDIRKMGACWNCWVMKVPCSEGPLCQRCQKAISVGTKCFCQRGSLNSNFMEILFPAFLFDRYLSISSQNDCVISWDQEPMAVQVTWGARAQVEWTMYVNRYESHGTHGISKGQYGALRGFWSLPLAVRDMPLKSLADSWSIKLKTLILGPNFPSYDPIHQNSDLIKIILEAVLRYYESNEDNALLQSCFLLYLSLYFSTQPAIFTKDNQNPEICRLMTVGSPFFSSSLFNYQAECIFYRLAKSYADNVLTGLEKLLRGRSRRAWPVCFAAILMLCICMERLQLHSVTEARYRHDRPQDTKSTVDTSADEQQTSCRAIEDIPYGQLAYIFHTLYRTYKGDQGGFNPFLEGHTEDSEAALDESSKSMIRDIGEKIMADAPNTLAGHTKPLASHLEPMDFWKENTGRLVSKFLAPFVPPGKLGAEGS